MKGRPTPKNLPTQREAHLAQTTSEQFMQTVTPVPFKISRKQTDRVCANCLCKCFLFGWVFFTVRSPCTEISSKSLSLQCFPGRRKLWFLTLNVIHEPQKPDPKNRNEGKLAKAILLQNHWVGCLSLMRKQLHWTSGFPEPECAKIAHLHSLVTIHREIRADFREGDGDSNF